MTFIQVGDVVRIYHEEDCFDEGEVISISNAVIVVDFYDWIECWQEREFTLRELYHEGIAILQPVTRGNITVHFHSTV